jgi:hypothetical protein
MTAKKFEIETLAAASLIENKRPDCVDALEKLFWIHRGEGLDIRESYEKAIFLHFLSDHNEFASDDPDFQLRTDEDVRMFSQEGLNESLAAGETDGEELIGVFTHWYDLYRSWGGSVFHSYAGSTRVLTEIYDEAHDLDETETREHFAGFPNKDIRAIALLTFQSYLDKGETVRKSAERTVEDLKEYLLKKQLGMLE